jgi:hypothetical protein
LDQTPSHCYNREDDIDCEDNIKCEDSKDNVKCEDSVNREDNIDRDDNSNGDDNNVEPHDESPDKSDPADKSNHGKGACGQPLFCVRQSVKTPVQKFAYQSLNEWIGRLLCQPNIEDALD